MSLVSSRPRPRLGKVVLVGFFGMVAAFGGASSLKAWSLSLSADYFASMQGVNPASSFGLSASKVYQEKYRTFFSQSLVKPYYIYEGEPEFDFADSSFGISGPLPEWFEGLKLSWNLAATLPLSDYSRRNEVYTKPQAAISASESRLDDRLSLQYGAYFRAFFSKYQSERTGHGRGGRPLPILSYGVSHSGSYKISDAYSAAYSLAYNETHYYSLDPVGSETIRAIDLPDQTYAVSFSTSWAATDAWSWSLGLTQGSQILHAGTVDLVLYDEDRSQWFVATRYSF